MKTNFHHLLLALLAVVVPGAAARGAPAITQQPVSANWTLGQTGTLTVAATGSGPLSYQWRKFGAPIAGATSAMLTVPNVTLADAGLYDVAVSDGAGTLASAAAQVDPVPAVYPNTLRPKPGFNPRIEFVATGTALIPLAGGGFYAFGTFTRIDGTDCNGAARFLANGMLDPSFTPARLTGEVRAAAVQSDGKLVIGGAFRMVAGVSRNYIARLNSDGTLDTSFAVDAGFDANINALALQSDGKVVVGGDFTSYNGTSRLRIARLNADGSLDSAFGADTGLNGPVRALVIQAGGKIVAGGLFNTFNGIAISYLTRLNADGSLDTAFGANSSSGVNGNVFALTLDHSGKILVGGRFTTYGSTPTRYLARLNADGTLDSAFSLGGNFINGTIRAIAIDASGRIFIGGSLSGSASSTYFARINAADGTVDTTFPAAVDNQVNAIAPLTDGRIAISGFFTKAAGQTHYSIARFNADGSLDSSLGAALREPAVVTAIQPLANGQWLIGGGFVWVNDVPANCFARLNADGSTDTAYAAALGTGFVGSANASIFNISLDAIVAQPDGKVYVSGLFSTVNGVSCDGLIRLNANGTVDTAFHPVQGAGSSKIASLALQADGKLLTGGYTYGGVNRLNADGTADPSFTPSAGFNSVQVLRVQPDGKILIGGTFTSYNGSPAGCFIRLNANGTADTSFTTGTGFNGAVYKIVPRLDGRIWVSGSFTSYNGTPCSKLVLLTASGALDPSYALASPFNGYSPTLYPQSDGRVVILSDFATPVGGYDRSFLIRTEADGTVDPTFSVPTLQPGSLVFTNSQVSYLGDGSLLVTGTRFDFAEGFHSGLALLEPVGPIVTSQPAASASVNVGGTVTFTVTATAGSALTYQWYHGPRAIPGATGPSYTITDAKSYDRGSYTARVTSEQTTVTTAASLLTVNVPPATGHLVNLSTRAAVGTGDNVLIVGFVVTGTAPKPVLIRGVGGATLALQNVSSPLPDPVLDLYLGSAIGHNDNWAASANPADIAAVADRVGAFALPAGSVDSALSTTLQPGVYSAILYGAGAANTGVALVEIYDAQEALTATTPRLVNLSSRGFVGTGDKVMIAGFVVNGDQARQVLIRGIGPTLTTMNVSPGLVLADPAIYLHHGSDLVASNDNWGSAGDGATLDAAASATGAFFLPEGSKDAAMLVTLQPGVYSVIVAGTGGTTGIALVELYELP